MSQRARIAIVAIAAVALVIAFFGARGSDDQDDPPATTTTPAATAPAPAATTQTETEPTATTGEPAPEPEIPEIRIAGGKPQGGVAKLEFDKGDTVEFFVRSDAAGHVHVHGYDILRDLKPGRRVRFEFEAKLDGRFEVELEDTATQIARLDVQP